MTRKTPPAMPRASWPQGAELIVDVVGIVPAAKGSMRGFVVNGRAIVTDSKGPRVKAFAAALRDAALEALTKSGLACSVDQPMEIQAAIYLPRPRATDRAEPWVAPDLDKLCRNVLDALTGVVYDDDSRVTRLVVQKKYAGASHDVGIWLCARVRPATRKEANEWARGNTKP